MLLGRAALCAAAAVASKVLLVESPAKAKKIQQFLGEEYKASLTVIRMHPPGVARFNPNAARRNAQLGSEDSSRAWGGGTR